MKLYPKLVKKTFTIKEKRLSDCRPCWVTIQQIQVRYRYGSPKEVDVIQRQLII